MWRWEAQTLRLCLQAVVGRRLQLAPGFVVFGAVAIDDHVVPHSRKWPSNLLAGHLVSALLEVACGRNIPFEALAPASAVGPSIGAMRLLKRVHPPVGATALNAFIGGEHVHQLGYRVVGNPVFLSSIVLVCAGGALYPSLRTTHTKAEGAPS